MDTARARRLDHPARRGACRRHPGGAGLLTVCRAAIPGCSPRWRRAAGSASRDSSPCRSWSGSTPASASTSRGACGPGIATGCRRSMPSPCWCRRPASQVPASPCATSPSWRSSPASCARSSPVLQAPDAAGAAELYRIADSLMTGAALLLLACFAARPLRDLWDRRAGVVRLTYSDRKQVDAPDRPHRPGDEPHRRHPACLGVRRARPLLDLPRPDRRSGSRPAAAARTGRAEGAGAGRRAGECPAGLPASPAARPLSHHDPAAGIGRTGRGLSPAAAGAWRRALRRHPVRRHPRLHLDLRGQAAVRRRVPAQPLFPRHRPGGRSRPAGGSTSSSATA